MAAKFFMVRECCKKVVGLESKVGALSFYTCECGRKVQGQNIKWFDKEADAKKALAAKGSDMDVGDQLAGM